MDMPHRNADIELVPNPQSPPIRGRMGPRSQISRSRPETSGEGSAAKDTAGARAVELKGAVSRLVAEQGGAGVRQQEYSIIVSNGSKSKETDLHLEIPKHLDKRIDKSEKQQLEPERSVSDSSVQPLNSFVDKSRALNPNLSSGNRMRRPDSSVSSVRLGQKEPTEHLEDEHVLSTFHQQKNRISLVITAASAAGEENAQFEFTEDKHLSEEHFSGSGPSRTLSAGSQAAGSTAKKNADRLSFKTSDEFFHGMLSYRVRTEGPKDSGGNNLARLIYDACCNFRDTKNEKSETPSSENLRHFFQALQNFGKWPKVFSGQSQIRLFLDQANLRMGVPWKGTGDADSGGFLGAVSQALVLVPLLSANPAPFKIVCRDVEGSSKKYVLVSPINMKLKNGTEILSIETDTQTIRGHSCTDVQPDGSFGLSDVPENVSAAYFTAKFNFFSTSNYLPSDGSGPRGSLADLLIIQQQPEELTFKVISVSNGHVILQVEQLSDHVFFPNEPISFQMSQNVSLVHTLDLAAEKISAIFKVVQVVCQGSKVGDLLSRIKIDAGNQLEFFSGNSFPISGSTQEVDRCDNVLMELMLCRALRTLSAKGSLHPCKLIMPVFVDDMDVLYPLSDRLSDKFSVKTSEEVQKALESILNRALTEAEVTEWIKSPIRKVVKFYFDFQGLQLSNKTNRYKSMEEKASLVGMHFITTAGIEANNNALLQYISSNPLAFELLEFLDECGLRYLHPVLVKNDITSVKELSQLTQSAIEKIAHDGHELSTRPLMKETVEICSAVSAAKSSKFILPVSKRLELFEDKDASFLTVVYSSFAIYLALQKPIFSLGISFIYLAMPLGIAVSQSFDDPLRYLPFIIGNYTRACWMISSIILVHVFNSFNGAVRAWIFWTVMIGISCIVGFILDKVQDGKFKFDYSRDCTASFPPQLYPTRYAECVIYYYPFFAYNTLLYWLLAYYLLFRQDLVWICVTIGISLQVVIASLKYVDPGTDSITPLGLFASIFILSMLGWTELLRFYGSLQALQITKKDSMKHSKNWKLVKDDQDIKKMAHDLNKQPFSNILDRSLELGKYRSAQKAPKKASPVQQETKNFDELYKTASVVNTCFQTWIESFFTSDSAPENFLYVEECDNIEHLHKHLRFEKSFTGVVFRGPVKLPERAIAKVYRTYRGDVSLITDIVRCAVQFETASEMRKFVSMWIVKYGQVREIEEKVGWLKSIWKDASECLRIFGEYFRNAAESESVDAEETDGKYQHASKGVEEFKLFEVCRIRNRLDPDLIDVPGGYRDLAFKLKMGFVMLPDSGAVRILPVGKWSTSTLRPKFIIVELQLLLQIMKCNEQMHQNYATMRDKMTN